MRPPVVAPIELVRGLSVLATFAVCYLSTGFLLDVTRRRRQKRRRRLQESLGAVLFRPVPEAAVAAERLARGGQRTLFDLLQRLAVDLNGEADRRLRVLVAVTGLDSRIRRRIRSRSWRSRAQGAALASLLPAGDPARLALLRDRNALVRARAVEAMEADDVADNAELVTALLDDDSRAVQLAARGAMLRGGTSVVPAVAQHLSALDGTGTAYALEVAANLADPRLAPAIEHHARSPRAQSRALAAKALGPLAPGSAAVTELLGDPSPEVRAAAALAIGNGGVELRAADVGRLLRDQSWSVRRAAGQALATMGPTGIATLRVYAEDRDAYARDLARQVLATLDARTTLVRAER
jgi:hypothetical protein